MAGAASFSTQTTSPTRAARELGAVLSRVVRPAGALVFASGRLAQDLPGLARSLAETASGTPFIVVAGAGVLSDQGEIENDSAVTGITWTGGRVETVAIPAGSADEAGEAIGRTLTDRAARSAPTAIVFVRPEGFSPTTLEPVQDSRSAGVVMGAGTLGVDPIAVDAEGHISAGRAAVMLIRGLTMPVVRSSPACRLLMPLSTITETRGSLVTRIGSEPALDVLSAAGEGLEEQPLILAALADAEERTDARPEIMLRAVQGVDPIRRGLLISEEIREGQRIAFAIRDPAAARADLETASRDVLRHAAGAAPRFGLYFSCAGRGTSLYGLPDVDTKILRARFGDLPFAGLHSSFEIAPHAGRPSLLLFTGVVALFSAPS